MCACTPIPPWTDRVRSCSALAACVHIAGCDHLLPSAWIDTKHGSIPIVKLIYQANVNMTPLGPYAAEEVSL